MNIYDQKMLWIKKYKSIRLDNYDKFNTAVFVL